MAKVTALGLVQGLVMASALGLVAYSAYATCCENRYIWHPNTMCQGPSKEICDLDPAFGLGRESRSYRPRGCTTYTGSFAAGPCSSPPSQPGTWIQLPGYPGTGCCWFSGTITFTQSGTDLVAACDGQPCSGQGGGDD